MNDHVTSHGTHEPMTDECQGDFLPDRPDDRPDDRVNANVESQQQKDKHRASTPNLGLPTLQLPLGPSRRRFSYRSSGALPAGRSPEPSRGPTLIFRKIHLYGGF